jgi:hypothetical protein
MEKEGVCVQVESCAERGWCACRISFLRPPVTGGHNGSPTRVEAFGLYRLQFITRHYLCLFGGSNKCAVGTL